MQSENKNFLPIMDVTVREVQSISKVYSTVGSISYSTQSVYFYLLAAKHGGHHMHATERIKCDLGFQSNFAGIQAQM